jgi:hypothetical protein
MPGPCPGRSLHQATGLVTVTFLGARSPVRNSMSPPPSRPCRLNIRTSNPASCSLGTTSRPSVPVPPVTRAFMLFPPCHICRV